MKRHITFWTMDDTPAIDHDPEYYARARIMVALENIIPHVNIKLDYTRVTYKENTKIRWALSSSTRYIRRMFNTNLDFFKHHLKSEEIVKKYSRIGEYGTQSWILKKVYRKTIDGKILFCGVIESSKSPRDESEIIDMSYKLLFNHENIPYDELRLSKEELHREFHEWYFAPSRLRFFCGDD